MHSLQGSGCQQHHYHVHMHIWASDRTGRINGRSDTEVCSGARESSEEEMHPTFEITASGGACGHFLH